MEQRTVVLCPNPYKDRQLAVTLEAKALLERAGFTVYISPEYLDGDAPLPTGDLELRELSEVADSSALVVSLGGDGTIMHTARRLIGHRVPIIGINLGTVGFLAELEYSDLFRLVPAAEGSFIPSPRMMLQISVERGGDIIYTDYALNDVSVHGITQTIRITASGDGHTIFDYSGDGIVVSSPTGSTAYSLSAGGPLVEPTAENIILTPVCAHALAAHPFVLASERVVSVRVGCRRGRQAIMSIDGGNYELADEDVLHIRKSRYQTLLAHVGTKAFYDIVYEKLGETK